MSVTTMSSDRGTLSVPDRAPLLHWMIFTGLCAFAGVLLWQYGLLRLMVASDRTYISSIICVLYLASSLHCLWRTLAIAREADASRDAALMLAETRFCQPRPMQRRRPGETHCRPASCPIIFAILS